MHQAFRQGHIEIDFVVPPFDSITGLWQRATRHFLAALPFLAAVSLSVFLPGKLLVQVGCEAFGLPPEGVIGYLLSGFSDLIFAALVAPTVIFGLVRHLRKGQAGSLSEAFRWGRRQWRKSFWNELKMEITIMLWTVLLIVPGIVATVKLIFTDPIVAIDADRENDVLQRSRELTEGRRWRIFLALLPAAALSLAHLYAGLRALQYSRWMAVPVDSLFSVLDQWLTVVTLLMFLGLTVPATTEGARRKAA